MTAIYFNLIELQTVQMQQFWGYLFITFAGKRDKSTISIGQKQGML